MDSVTHLFSASAIVGSKVVLSIRPCGHLFSIRQYNAVSIHQKTCFFLSPRPCFFGGKRVLASSKFQVVMFQMDFPTEAAGGSDTLCGGWE